jgi:DNA (cytosine-5)-methyltransferase 1
MEFADLFAGWGGFTEGAKAAGATPVYAANHWPVAVAAHAANHPGAIHECQDLNQANFHALPDIDLLLASPACQGHSQAAQPSRKRDGSVKRHHDALRSTAWAVVSAADAKRPQHFVVENVADFQRWQLYPVWKLALQTLGYQLEEHFLTASHMGVPQRRKRLFIVGTLAKNPIGLTFEREAEPAFGPCIDWDQGEWELVDSKSAQVRKRVMAGRARHGARFLTQHVTGHKGVGLHEPIRTITCQDQWAVVDGDRMRPLTIRENARGMGFRDDYEVPAGIARRDAVKGFGNAVCPPQAKRIVRKLMAA